MNYFNYKISGSKGKLFLSSKEPLHGYDKVEYGTDNDRKVVWHKYIDRVTGTFTGFSMKEVPTDKATLTFLEITLMNGEDQNKISVNLKTPKGNVSDEAKALISAFYGAKVNHEYTLSSVMKTNTSNGKEYKNLSVYVNSTTEMNDVGKGLSTGFIAFADIPRAEKEDDGLGGFTYNNKAPNTFWGGKLKEISARFDSGNIPASPSNTASTAPTKSEPAKAMAPNESFDEDTELPF